jgi:hypothetical protein
VIIFSKFGYFSLQKRSGYGGNDAFWRETAKTCQHLPTPANTCQHLQSAANTCKELQSAAKTCKDLQNAAKRCKPLRDCKVLPSASRASASSGKKFLKFWLN